MKYQLKDRELQKKLDDISDGDFSKKLDSIAQSIIASHLRENIMFGEVDGNPSAKKFSLACSHLDIEEVHDYDPHDWNEFPDVNPPEDRYLQIEIYTLTGQEVPERNVCERGCAFYDSRLKGFVIQHGNDHLLLLLSPDSRLRFRPWED